MYIGRVDDIVREELACQTAPALTHDVVLDPAPKDLCLANAPVEPSRYPGMPSFRRDGHHSQLGTEFPISVTRPRMKAHLLSEH